MGRWSRLVAPEFLEWLPVNEKVWLDVGCGTGNLSYAVLNVKEPKEVLAVDSSAAFIRAAQEANRDSRLRFKVASAQSLPSEPNSFDAAVSGLVLNFVPQSERAVAEMIRVTKPGGTVGAFVWDYGEGMQMLRLFWDAAKTLDKDAAKIDEAVRFSLCSERGLESVFLECGLQNVMSKAITVATTFSSFDDYWEPFLGGVGSAPSYVATLGDTVRERLKEHLRIRLPISDDGTISLTARAWAARGTVGG